MNSTELKSYKLRIDNAENVLVLSEILNEILVLGNFPEELLDNVINALKESKVTFVLSRIICDILIYTNSADLYQLAISKELLSDDDYAYLMENKFSTPEIEELLCEKLYKCFRDCNPLRSSIVDAMKAYGGENSLDILNIIEHQMAPTVIDSEYKMSNISDPTKEQYIEMEELKALKAFIYKVKQAKTEIHNNITNRPYSKVLPLEENPANYKKNIKNSHFDIAEITSISPYFNLLKGKELPCFILLIDGKPLETPKGNYFIHKNKLFLKHIIFDDLELKENLDPTELSLYSMFSTFKDFIEKNEKNKECFRDDIEHHLLCDVSLRTCAGPEIIDQYYRSSCIEDFFKTIGIGRTSLPQTMDEKQVREWIDCSEGAKNNFDELIKYFKDAISNLNDIERCIIICSVCTHGSFILGYLLATSRCLPTEYVNAVMAFSGMLQDFGLEKKEQKECLEGLKMDTEILISFRNLQPIKDEMSMLIELGESVELEFKSTLRVNLHTGQPDKRMEHSVLKTVVAFLNCNGGTLLIGVTDEGKVLGIEADNFKNSDEYLLHFTNLINNNIGAEYTTHIKYRLVETTGNLQVLKIDCQPTNKQVFLKNKGDEEFYIRTGPSSIQLKSSKMIEYIETRFKNKD